MEDRFSAEWVELEAEEVYFVEERESVGDGRRRDWFERESTSISSPAEEESDPWSSVRPDSVEEVEPVGETRCWEDWEARERVGRGEGEGVRSAVVWWVDRRGVTG